MYLKIIITYLINGYTETTFDQKLNLTGDTKYYNKQYDEMRKNLT